MTNGSSKRAVELVGGVKLCKPCTHLVEVTGQRSLLPNLIHRGGLHAEIVVGGEIEVGDLVGPGRDD